MSEKELAQQPKAGVKREKIVAKQKLEVHGPEEKREKKPLDPKCLTVLESLESAEEAFFFLDPVDPIALGIPTYFQVIKEPMDFSQVKKKLEDCVYLERSSFEKDLKLVFSNAMLFNAPASEVFLAAERMDKKASDLLKESFPNDNN